MIDRTISLLHPSKTVFGIGSINQFIQDYLAKGLQRLFIVTIPAVAAQLSDHVEKLKHRGIQLQINDAITGEPSFNDFEKVLHDARTFKADSVIGIGGGSVLDTAKLIAAQLYNTQSTKEVQGIGNLKQRSTYLACIPTTSGTGSEMSPNAIFLNDNGDKIGVISPYLVPDASYIDPALTVSVPPLITASAGIDALAHCLEAYTNAFAHPVVDLVALEGIRLTGRYLKRACENGSDLEARMQVALGSMYGGMCLGPVNTAAVHALAYPLGAEFHLPHGLSIALLLPPVMAFNLPAAPVRYAAVALALGADQMETDEETGKQGIEIIRTLIRECRLPSTLQQAGVKWEALEGMAAGAMSVQRLLKNNIREVTQQDALDIFRAAF